MDVNYVVWKINVRTSIKLSLIHEFMIRLQLLVGWDTRNLQWFLIIVKLFKATAYFDNVYGCQWCLKNNVHMCKAR